MKKTTFHIVMISMLALLFGCGTSEYERRLQQGAADVAGSSKFAALGEPTSIPNTQATLRFPAKMQPIDIGDPQRGKCAVLSAKGDIVLEMQGQKSTYEGTLKDDKGNDMHFYMYVGASEMGPNGVLPTRIWLNNLQDKFPKNEAENSTDVNKNFTADSPEGTSVPWEEFHFKYNQKFFYPTNENPQNYQEMMGTLVCLSHAENGYYVMLWFRYPSVIDGRHAADFDSDWAKLVAGSLKVEAAQ
jgi:hypothetical protein